MLLYVSSQLDLAVEISLDLVNDQASDTLLVEDLAPAPLKLGDFLGLIRDMSLIFPPILVQVGLGWIKKVKYIIVGTFEGL